MTAFARELTQKLNGASPPKDSDEITTGFYELADTDTRTNVIAFFDGKVWSMPGSNLEFPPQSVAYRGVNPSGRFQYVRRVGVSQHAYGQWNVESGRHF